MLCGISYKLPEVSPYHVLQGPFRGLSRVSGSFQGPIRMFSKDLQVLVRSARLLIIRKVYIPRTNCYDLFFFFFFVMIQRQKDG